MNDFISTFSFYGVLRIIIPGLHLFIGLNGIANKIGVEVNLYENITLNTIAVTILIIVLGLFIYSFDFPRMIRKYTPSLPTRSLAVTYKDVDVDEIEKSYFRFYYSLEPDKKERTERYNGFYHLVVNLNAVSMFLILIQLFCFLFRVDTTSFLAYNVLILFLCSFNSVMIYKKRLVKTYKADMKLYYSSTEFENFKKQHNVQ